MTLMGRVTDSGGLKPQWAQIQPPASSLEEPGPPTPAVPTDLSRAHPKPVEGVFGREEQVLMPMARTAFKVQRSKSTCAQWGLGSSGVRPRLAQGQLPHTVPMFLCSSPEEGLAW